MDLEGETLEHLPIFPLRTVLFPGAIMPLHIFEDRYKRMIRYAVENDNLFGLSYVEEAAVGLETPPATGDAGCVARIKTLVPVEEGRMNLIVAGEVRYRVQQVIERLPFVIARVTPFTDDLEPGADLTSMFEDIFKIGKQFLSAAQMLDESHVSPNQLPEDPEAFSLLVASTLPVENSIKQALLETTSTRLRLTRLRHMLINVLTQYNKRLLVQERAKSNGHGKLS